MRRTLIATFWMRRFEDEAHRDRAYTAAYESDEWKRNILPTVNQWLIREETTVTRLIPTPKVAGPLKTIRCQYGRGP